MSTCRPYEVAGFSEPTGSSDRPRISHVISLGKIRYRFPVVRKGQVRSGGSDVAAYEPSVQVVHARRAIALAAGLADE
jgi:hypothetical protein